MFKILLVLSVLVSGSAFAQNMAGSESYESAYTQNADGSSQYVGKCSTHEDYEDVLYKIKKVIQPYFSPADLTESELKAILAKIDTSMLKQVLTTLDMYDISGTNSILTIFTDYIDDLTIESISLNAFPGLDLIRINIGVGGGNGSFMVFNKVKKGSKVTFEMMSETFDSDLNFCNKKVWL